MKTQSVDCNVTIIGAGPYGLSSAAYLRAAGIETRIFGEPMSFWENQMPAGMCLRSNWGASHIADPKQELTLDAYCHQNGNHISKPIPLNRFVGYGQWYQRQAVPDLDRRLIRGIEAGPAGIQGRRGRWRVFYLKTCGGSHGNQHLCRAARRVRWHSICVGITLERA